MKEFPGLFLWKMWSLDKKKENMLKTHDPGISRLEPVTKTKPWREPLRERNWQGQHLDSRGSLAGPGREDGRNPLKLFVRATLQESLQFHRPDFISHIGERIKRLKLIVQERKLQSMLKSERDALFDIDRERQGHQNRMRPLPKRVFLAIQKNKPISKKEMIQRSKWTHAGGTVAQRLPGALWVKERLPGKGEKHPGIPVTSGSSIQTM
ncbi:putative ALMS1-like protein isoform X2 [Pan troglodytes]|uniref:putative ALMS1-like protein isoform X2 n=1 Tax=Pan troglodytes TaxID=9598 RepID=UPI0000E1F47F|nr:putative ALMS1-like protein [Pan troglodytes]